MSDDVATSRDACDECAGRTPIRVTCSAHFLAWLDSHADTDDRRDHAGERGA